MADSHIAKILHDQTSLTDLLGAIKHKDWANFQQEDTNKRERLTVLNKVIGLPFDKPTKFKATELVEKSERFQKYFAEHNDEMCAIRLNPIDSNSKKLRLRGETVAEAYKWFLAQRIDPAKYSVDFIQHQSKPAWATIFVVNRHGVHGEIIFGGHHLLSQGIREEVESHQFSFDFEKWQVEPENEEVSRYLKGLIKHLLVTDKKAQAKLKEVYNASFSRDYLNGYFETQESEFGTWYIDYSPWLGEEFKDYKPSFNNASSKALVFGRLGSPGKATGPVRIVADDALDNDFPSGSILVCKLTTPNFVPLMQKAAAIVTDQGGILSHAAIVARELKKPCIVATQNATAILKDGQIVTVDAETASVWAGKN